MHPPDATLDINDLVVDDEAASLADQRFALVNHYHALAKLSMAQSCAYMVLAGVELMAIKKTIKHGEWEKLFSPSEKGSRAAALEVLDAPKGSKAHAACVFGMSIRTAQKYMGLAAAAKKNIKELQRLCGGDVPISQMALEDREKVIKAVRKVADGSTYQQLAFEWDLAKKPLGSGSSGGHRPGASKNDPEPEEDEDGYSPEQRSARAIWLPVMADLELEGLKEESYVNLPDKDKERLNGIIVDLKRRLGGK